jgi:hypothetical protein
MNDQKERKAGSNPVMPEPKDPLMYRHSVVRFEIAGGFGGRHPTRKQGFDTPSPTLTDNCETNHLNPPQLLCVGVVSTQRSGRGHSKTILVFKRIECLSLA